MEIEEKLFRCALIPACVQCERYHTRSDDIIIIVSVTEVHKLSKRDIAEFPQVRFLLRTHVQLFSNIHNIFLQRVATSKNVMWVASAAHIVARCLKLNEVIGSECIASKYKQMTLLRM